MAAAADKIKPYIPLAGCADDGWTKEDQATATCYCGGVQLAFVSVPKHTNTIYNIPLMSRKMFSRHKAQA
jgi:hypothetical protein